MMTESNMDTLPSAKQHPTGTGTGTANKASTSTAAATGTGTTKTRPLPRPERPSPLKHLAMRRGSNGDMQQFLRRRSSASSAHRSAMALALANLESSSRGGVKALPEHYRKRARAQYSKSRKQLLVASITSSVLARLEAARLKAQQQQQQQQGLQHTPSQTLSSDKPLPPTPPPAGVGLTQQPAVVLSHTQSVPEEQEEPATDGERESDSEYTDVSSDSGSPASSPSTSSSAWYSPTASDTEHDDDDDLSDTDAESDTSSMRAIRTLRTNKDYDPTRPPIVDMPTADPSTVPESPRLVPATTCEPPTAADMLVAGMQQAPPPASDHPHAQQTDTLTTTSSELTNLPPPPHRRSSLVATLSRRISLAPYQTSTTTNNGASPSTFLPPAPLPEHPESISTHVPVVPIPATHAASPTTVPTAVAAPSGSDSLPASSNPSPNAAVSVHPTQPSSERQVRAAALKSILSRRISNPMPATHPFPALVPSSITPPLAVAPGLIADPPIVRSHPPSATLAPPGQAFPSPPPARTTRSPSLPHLFASGVPRSHTLPPSHMADAAHAFPATRSRSMSIPTCLLAGRRKKPPPPPLNLEGLTESFTRDMGKVKQVVRSKSLAELEEERAKKGFPRDSEAPEAFRKPETAPEADDQPVPAGSTERRPSLVKTIHVRPQKGLVASPESFVDESSATEDLAGVAPAAALGDEDPAESTVTSATSETSSTVPLPVSLTRRPVRPAGLVSTDDAKPVLPRTLHVSASTPDLHLAACAAAPTAGSAVQGMLSPRAFHFSGALQVLNDAKSAWLKRHLTFDGRTLTCLAHRTAPHLAGASVGALAEWTLDVSKIVLLALVSKRPSAPSPPNTTDHGAWKLAFTISTAHADHVLRAGSQAELSNWMYVLGRAREMVQLQQTVANLMATVRDQQGRELHLGGAGPTGHVQDRGVKRPTTDPTGQGMLSPVRVPGTHGTTAAPVPTVVAVKSVTSSLNRPPPIVTGPPAAAPAADAHAMPVRHSMVASIVSTTASPESDYSPFRSPATASTPADMGPRPVPVQLPGGAPQSAHLDLLVVELSRAMDALDPPSPPSGGMAGAPPVDPLKHVAAVSRALAHIEAMVGPVNGLHAFVSATRTSWDAAAAAVPGAGAKWVADGHTARVRALARMVSDWPRVIVGASPDKKPHLAPPVRFGASGVVADSAVSVGTMVDAAQ